MYLKMGIFFGEKKTVSFFSRNSPFLVTDKEINIVFCYQDNLIAATKKAKVTEFKFTMEKNSARLF